jgi:tetratricopeptide (TPR) repeat protein
MPRTKKTTAVKANKPIIDSVHTVAEKPVVKEIKNPIAVPIANAKPRQAKKKSPYFGKTISWLAIFVVVLGACYALTYGGLLERIGAKSAVAPGDETVRLLPRDRSAQGNVIQGRVPSVGEEPLREAGADISLAYREAGIRRLLAGDLPGALTDFTIAIERNPAEPTNWIFRGEILMQGDNFEAAIADFNNAARLDPFSMEAYFNRALAHIAMERLDDAKSDLDLAINARMTMPNRAAQISTHDIYARRAQVNLWLRNWAEAEMDYTSAIAQNRGAQDWLDFTGRAEARTMRNNFEGAIQDYVSAVTIISERIQQTPAGATREDMSRQALSYFEKSAALRIQLGQMQLAREDLGAAQTLAVALGDSENIHRLNSLIQSLPR